MIEDLDEEEKQALIEEQELIDSQFAGLEDEDELGSDEFNGF